MRRHGTALQFSLALHALLFAAFASMGGALSTLAPKSIPAAIEFDLEGAETVFSASGSSGAPAQKALRVGPTQKSFVGASDTVPPATATQPVAEARDTHGPVEEGHAPLPGDDIARSEGASAATQTAAASFPEGAAGGPAPTASLRPAQQEGRAPGVQTGASGIAEGIRSRIEALKSYPFAARRRGVEGTVVVFVKVNGTGDLIEHRIQRSSGSPLLDESALSLIKKVFPYTPGAGREVELDIPITYRLKS